MKNYILSTMCLWIAVAAPVNAADLGRIQDGSEIEIDRTPAKAQRFLAMFPPVAFGKNAVAYKVFQTTRAPTSSDACRTSFFGSAAHLEDGHLSKDDSRAALENNDLPDLDLDWSRVGRISKGDVQNLNAIFLFSGDPEWREIRFLYTSGEHRDRIMVAMQYLKSACDKAKDLNF